MPNPHPLIVEPFNGLANRLMAVLSAFRLARHFDRPLGLCWRADEHLAADFDTLFDIRLPRFARGDLGPATRFLDIDWSSGSFTVPPSVSDEVPGAPLWIRSHAVLAHSDEPRHSHFFTYDPVVRELGQLFWDLRPSFPVRQILERWAHLPFERMIGVHIRRSNPRDGNGLATLDASLFGGYPTDADYARHIEALLAWRDDVLVYLSSNAPETESWLSQRFGDRLVVRSRQSVDRSLDEAAAVEAMADLILLARCAMILRYKWTTFPLLSSFLGQKDSIVLLPQDKDGSEQFGFIAFGANARVSFHRLRDIAEAVRQTSRIVPCQTAPVSPWA